MTVMEFTLVAPKPTSDSITEPKQLPKSSLSASTATLPVWCRLQYEIAGEIDLLLKSIHHQQQIDARLETRIGEINAKIDQYNDQVPNAYLRKPKLPVHSIEQIASLAVLWG
jgi:hypothetical protein